MRGPAALAGLLALFATGSVAARQPEGTPTPATILQLRDSGLRMSVPVSVAGAGPFPFIVDTGSERTVVSRELAGLLKLPRGHDVQVTSMAGTRTVGTVQLPGFTVSSIAGGAVDAPSFVGSFLGAPGLIGVDTLQDKAVVIDFDKGQMSIRPSQRRHRLRDEPGDIVVRAKNIYGQLVVTNARYNGHAVRVILDTGSEISVGNPALQRLMHLPKFDQVTLTSVTGDAIHADYAVARELEIGGLLIHDLPMGFVDAAPFRRFGLTTQPALMLGMDALRMFRRIAIDFPNRALLFAVPRTVRSASAESALSSLPTR